MAERESDSSTRRHILVNAKFHAEARDASANMCEETEETGRPLARRDYPTLSMGDDSQKRKQTNNRSNKRATYTTCIVSNVSSEERERTLSLVARSNSSLVVAGSAKMISMFTLARCTRDCGRKVHFHARSVTFKILTDSLFRTTTREIFAEFDCPAAFLDDQIWRFGEQQTRIVREEPTTTSPNVTRTYICSTPRATEARQVRSPLRKREQRERGRGTRREEYLARTTLSNAGCLDRSSVVCRRPRRRRRFSRSFCLFYFVWVKVGFYGKISARVKREEEEEDEDDDDDDVARHEDQEKHIVAPINI